jgi:hypothetical protein
VQSDTGPPDKYFLPPKGWSRHLSKYVYKDPKLQFGPIKGATLDIGKGAVSISGKGAQLTRSLATMPAAVGVTLVDGLDQFCATFGEHIRTTPLKKFSATFVPPPDSCPEIQL